MSRALYEGTIVIDRTQQRSLRSDLNIACTGEGVEEYESEALLLKGGGISLQVFVQFPQLMLGMGASKFLFRQ